MNDNIDELGKQQIPDPDQPRPDQEFYDKNKDNPAVDFGTEGRDDPHGYYGSAKAFNEFRHLINEHGQTKLKDRLYRHPGQEIRNIGNKGYGVIATMPIKKGEIIEECVVAYETIEPGWEYLDGMMYARNQNVLGSYRFAGPGNSNSQTQSKNAQCWVVAFGNASIYNHSDDPNVVWYHEAQHRLIVIQARKDIEPGEELCHCYNFNRSVTITREEVQELIGKKHYNPQFMRDEVIVNAKKSASGMYTAPDHVKPVTKNAPVDKSDPKPYKKRMLGGRLVSKPVAKQIDGDVTDVDPDWEPPNLGEKKVTTEEFIKHSKDKPSFDHLKGTNK